MSGIGIIAYFCDYFLTYKYLLTIFGIVLRSQSSVQRHKVSGTASTAQLVKRIQVFPFFTHSVTRLLARLLTHSLTHTHSLMYSLAHSHTHSVTHILTLTHSHIHSSLSHTLPNSFTRSHTFTNSLTQSYTHSYTITHTLTQSLAHSHTLTHSVIHTLTHILLTHTHSFTYTYHSLTHSLTDTLTDKITHSFIPPQSNFINYAGLELVIFLHPPPQDWDYKSDPPCQVEDVLSLRETEYVCVHNCMGTPLERMGGISSLHGLLPLGY